MGLMEKLREQTHIILWALIILFVLSMTIGGLVGGANVMDIITGKSKLRGLAGIVDDRELKAENFSRMVEYQLNQYREQGRPVDDRTVQQVSDQVWDSFVNEVVVGGAIKQLDLATTDREIYYYLRNNPPEFLQQHEAFQTDGQFDYQKYLDRLNNPQGNEWFPVEQQVRASLPYQKVSNLIQNLVTVSEWEIRMEYMQANLSFEFESLTLPFALVQNDSLFIPAQEVRDYYQSHKEDYFVDETRVLDYVFFKLNPAPSDTQMVRHLAQDLKQRIKGGESFKTVAAEYTEDPSGKNSGGDLGWFERGQMVPPFEKVAFNTPIGQVAGPVLTSFGYHLIKVEDKQVQKGKEQVKARHILLKINAGPETRSKISSQANLFAFDANEFGFQAAADSHNLRIAQTPALKEDTRFIRGLGLFPQATRFAFSNNPIGSISEVYRNENGYAVFRLARVKEAHHKPLSDIKETIEQKILTEKQVLRLRQKADTVYQQLDTGQALKALAQKYSGAEYLHHELTTLEKPIKSLGRDPQVIGSLLGLERVQISRPIRIRNNFVILRLISRSEFDKADYQAKRAEIYTQLYEQKQREFYNKWVAALKTKVEIIDNRANMYQ